MNKNNKKEVTILTYSMCEVEIDGKMALVSLYDDLPHFEYDLTIDKLKSSNNKLKILIQELEQHVRRIEKEHSQLKTTNEILSNNIVSLYKTACREIKRKDIMINELRNNCSKINPSPESKMFSSSKLLLEKTQFNDLPNEKQGTLQTSCDEEKSRTTNQNNCVNIPNIVVKPNNDIPKTVYYKRLCQKLTKQNENILSKNKTQKYIDTHTCTITSEEIQDKNVCLTNDQNLLKELESPVLCNDFNPNHNSTLIICEPDMPPSDSELSTTSVIQCNNSEKSKENISTKPSFLKLRPKICKKKFVITPASIGVLNVSNETSKCIEKLRNNKNLELKVVSHKISNPLETKLIKDPIEGSPPMSVEELGSNINADVDSKHVPRTGIIHDQKVFTHKINNETPPKTNEVLKVDFGKKTALVKNNSVKLTMVKNSSKVTGSSPLIDSFKISTDYEAKSSMNNKHKPSNQPSEKNSELKCTLNDIDESSKSTAVATNLINSSSSINHPVNVTTVQKSTPVISLGPSVDNDTSPEYVNCSSKNNEKESSLTKGKNNQLKCMLNDNVESSPENTAVPTNLSNNISTQPKNSKTKKIDPVKVTTLRKSSQDISSGLSDVNDCKMSTNYVNCSSVTNEKESSQYKEKKIQLKFVSHDTVESSPKNTADETNITNKIITPSKIIETEKNDTFKVTTIKKSLRVISVGLSSDNDHNMSTKYVSCSSINYEKEFSQYKEKDNKLKCVLHCTIENSPKNTANETNFTNKMSTPYKSIETGQDTFKVTTIKSSRVISLGPSGDNDCNTSTEYVNCSSINNKKESSLYKEKDNQLKCISHYVVENSPKNTAYETNLTNKISTPYKSIVTGKNDTIKVTTVRKSPKCISSFSQSDDHGPNVTVTHVKCSSNVMETNSKNESFYLPKQTNSQLKCNVSNIINSSFNLAVETSPTNKIGTPFKNIEVDQVPARKSTENINFVKVIPVKTRVVSFDNDLNSLTKYVKCSSMTAEKESSSKPKEKNDQLGFKLNDVVKSTSKNISGGTNIGNNISTPSVHSKVEQVPTKTKKEELPRKHFPVETKVMKSSGFSVDCESNKFTKKVQCLPIKQNKDSSILLKQNDNQLTCKLSINNCKSDLKEITKSINHHVSFSKSTEVDSGKKKVLSTSIDFDNKLACSNLSQDEINQEFKKGRRVQLITIQDHYSEPLPSFNGAKKTEIDVSKNSVHIEKEVESSSRFYVPQMKRRKLSNFGNIEL